jgi:hypothetical protein
MDWIEKQSVAKKKFRGKKKNLEEKKKSPF